MYYEITEQLIEFIRKSPVSFQATEEMEQRFRKAGYQKLSDSGKKLHEVSYHGKSQ